MNNFDTARNTCVFKHSSVIILFLILAWCIPVKGTPMNIRMPSLAHHQEPCQEEPRATEVRGPNVDQLRRAVFKHGGEEGWTDL